MWCTLYTHRIYTTLHPHSSFFSLSWIHDIIIIQDFFFWFVWHSNEMQSSHITFVVLTEIVRLITAMDVIKPYQKKKKKLKNRISDSHLTIIVLRFRYKFHKWKSNKNILHPTCTLYRIHVEKERKKSKKLNRKYSQLKHLNRVQIKC